jgi:GDP-4-dehydro-6-deoxy-D-mannose reductase
VRVLVTGADGFVGRHLVRRLLSAGHEVAAGCRPRGAEVSWGIPAGARVDQLPLEITDDASIAAALGWSADAIVHLAAVASVREARGDPGTAWTVNAAGTARLVHAAAWLREARRGDPLMLLVSTGEVYGPGSAAPRMETDPLLPCSSYAASKVAAEVAALEAWRTTGIRVIVARPFTHTGPGQTTRYVIPAFVERLRAAKASGAPTVPTGNLHSVRDFLDVRDVVEAYLILLTRGVPGEIYNISRGEGTTLAELFRRLTELIGVQAEPRPDPGLSRATDIPHLVGDSTKLRRATQWTPSISLDQTLRELVDAEAD